MDEKNRQAMTNPYTEQAKALAALSAENGLLRAEVERLREALQRNEKSRV